MLISRESGVGSWKVEALRQLRRVQFFPSFLLSTAKGFFYRYPRRLRGIYPSVGVSRNGPPTFGSFIKLRPSKGSLETMVFVCRDWYANPVTPTLHHCQTALGRLPVHEDPILYRPLRRNHQDPRSLLVVETHGQHIITLLLPTAFGLLS